MMLIFWDVMFVLLRPSSFATGKLGVIWLPYTKYIMIDKSYADLDNPFVKAQAIMSLFEIMIGIIALYLHFQKNNFSVLFAFSTFLLTGTKTLFIFLLEFISGFKNIGHNQLADLLCFYFLPNSLWIIFPLVAVFVLARILINSNKIALPNF